MKIGNLEVYGIIYKIENLVNGKVYIGQTVSKQGFDGRYNCKGIGVQRVYNTYLSCKKRNTSYNKYLLRSLEKYGAECFKVDKIFDVAFSKEELDIKEDIWINYFDCIKHGYNNRGGGSNGKLSDDVINKMKERQIGSHHSDETKKKMSERQLGKLNHKAKSVICLNDLMKFDTIRECSEYYNINGNIISKVCRHDLKEINCLYFMFLEEYLEYENQIDINKIIENKNILSSKKYPIAKEIICINNGLIFQSTMDCERNSLEIFGVKLNHGHISDVCRGKRKHTGGFKFKFTSDLLEQEI